jgi:NTP pyrophosphatase (non-canonical NTP hydrolase)
MDDELFAIVSELQRVHAKFGTQSLTLFDWHCILSEEVGEVARAINEEHFNAGDLQSVYEECIQVAAVAVHMAAVIREANGA